MDTEYDVDEPIRGRVLDPSEYEVAPMATYVFEIELGGRSKPLLSLIFTPRMSVLGRAWDSLRFRFSKRGRRA